MAKQLALHTWVNTRAQMDARIHTHVHRWIHAAHRHACTHSHICTHVHKWMHAFMPIHKHAYTPTHAYAFKHTEYNAVMSYVAKLPNAHGVLTSIVTTVCQAVLVASGFLASTEMNRCTQGHTHTHTAHSKHITH